MQHPRRFCLMFCALITIAVAGSQALIANSTSNQEPGFVYVMTNLPGGNSIVVFRQAESGSLTAGGTFGTGGLGNGIMPDPLASQGGLILLGNFLFAVNAGSNDISVLRIKGSELVLVSTVASGGIRPTSLAVRRDLLYVVNAGSGTIVAFRVGAEGELTKIPDSTRILTGGASADPSQISFSPDGRLLIVPEKVPNLIDLFTVNDAGLTEGPFPNTSNGETPFGFDFDRAGHLIVSEAFGGVPNAGALSSYAVSPDGSLSVISGSVPDEQTAPCWVVTTKDGAFAYTTNTGSGSISSYRVHSDGALELIDSIAASTTPGGSPIDMALDRSGRFLYAQVNVTGTISGFRVKDDGSLTPISDTSGIPPFAQGIAAR
jgi:6-phosphogluconolactonase